MAMEVGCIVVVPLHRMPPENPYPAAYDDCFAVYKWLLENGALWGGDPGRIIINGHADLPHPAGFRHPRDMRGNQRVFQRQ